jgi:hypothetical protein
MKFNFSGNILKSKPINFRNLNVNTDVSLQVILKLELKEEVVGN